MTKDKSVLFFVLALVGTAITMLFHNGIGFWLFWENNPAFNDFILPFAGGLTNVFNLAFTISLLNLKSKFPKLHKIALGFVIINLLFTLAAPFVSYGSIIKPFMLVSFLVSIVCLIAGIQSLRNGYGPAKYFLAGWSIYFVGIILTIVNSALVLIPNLDSIEIIQISSAISILALSWSLSDRINLLQSDLSQSLIKQQIIEKEILAKQKVELEIQVKKRTQELEESHAILKTINENKTKFFGIVSHDLRNMISSFSGIGEMAKTYVEQKKFDRFNRITNLLDSSAANLNLFLESLLKWSMSEMGKTPYFPIQLNVEAEIRGIELFSKPLLEAKDLTLNLKCDDQLESYCDQQSFAFIVRNILSNAIKFSNPTGTIEIECIKFDQQCAISIRNSGSPIAPEVVEKITTNQSVQSTKGTLNESGTGFGLNMVYEFVVLNKGELMINNLLDNIVEFKVILPCKKVAPARIELASKV